jgi:hypothetical protein
MLLLAKNGGRVSHISYKKDLQKLNRELSVYHIEPEMQNDELRRAQEQFEESHSRHDDQKKLVDVFVRELRSS